MLLAGLLQQVVQQILRGTGLNSVAQFLYSPLGGLRPVGAVLIFLLVFGLYSYIERSELSLQQRYNALPGTGQRRLLVAGVVAALIAIFVLPQILGVFLSEVLNLIGIFLLMGLGLNLVVGFAGLLDLGYVAFFAVGAYVTAVLISPDSPAFAPEIIFWAALPFVIGAAALAGIIVGTPVLSCLSPKRCFPTLAAPRELRGFQPSPSPDLQPTHRRSSFMPSQPLSF
jgi:branched-chain amino acid transport system permease protein